MLEAQSWNMDIQIHSFHCDAHHGDIVVRGRSRTLRIDVCERLVAEQAVDPNCRVEVIVVEALRRTKHSEHFGVDKSPAHNMKDFVALVRDRQDMFFKHKRGEVIVSFISENTNFNSEFCFVWSEDMSLSLRFHV